MKHWMLLIFIMYMADANARALHIGTTTVPLNDTKQTSPALAVNINNKIYWGALFADTAAANTLRVRFDGTEYWLGEFCSPGTYAPAGTNTCIECGIGHYCTGGHTRAPCTYGAISCPNPNHATDPAGTANAPTNKFMTLDEVTRFIPHTDISQWRLLSCDAAFNHNVNNHDPESINYPDTRGKDVTLDTGTYLFIMHYPDTNFISSINQTSAISNAYIAVFDHPVGYRSVHGVDVFQHFVDTNNPVFKSWTISSATLANWATNENHTNIYNLSDTVAKTTLCVYELK